ncbi:hypothetical protein JZ751_001160 [Albula glossodonta]|uniref:Uncharacterized protein n=1 Tax=Albula glossodonta TaxID=121402 RepID=A0A8T2PSX4_9TELE|nr:hypothetical protein JZ751_001160 [Albula glossodonta]
MSKARNLKAFLASSLNEIFKATVNDILDSVEETLSEYQEKIQRIEAENENLRRSLKRHKDKMKEKTALTVPWLLKKSMASS